MLTVGSQIPRMGKRLIRVISGIRSLLSVTVISNQLIASYNLFKSVEYV